jgi:hypothetical protein
MPFSCSICGEESTRICVRCTKDACDNHLCEKCRKCSDCCECEVALAPQPTESVRDVLHAAVAHAEPIIEAAPAAQAETPKEEPPAVEMASAAVAHPAPDGLAEVPDPPVAQEQAVEAPAAESVTEQNADEAPGESSPGPDGNLLP